MSELLAKSPQDIQNMTAEEAKLFYDQLVSALSKMTDHEKTVWLEVQKKIDPKFVERQSSKKAEKKINDLRSERDAVFRTQVQEYNDKTNAKSAALILKNSSNYMKGLQDYVKKDSNDAMWKLNSDVMTLQRLSLNSQKLVSDAVDRNAYLRYVCTILCVCVLILMIGALKLLSFTSTMYTVFSVVLLGLVIIGRHYLNHMNDSKFYVHQKTFIPISDEYEDGLKEEKKCGPEVATRHEIIDDYSMGSMSNAEEE